MISSSFEPFLVEHFAYSYVQTSSRSLSWVLTVEHPLLEEEHPQQVEEYSPVLSLLPKLVVLVVLMLPP
jgi:hypothetical protein